MDWKYTIHVDQTKKPALTTCFGSRAAHLGPIELTPRHQVKVRPAFLSRHQGSQFSFQHLSVNELPVQCRPLIRVHIGYLLSSHLPVFIYFPYQAASILTGETKNPEKLHRVLNHVTLVSRNFSCALRALHRSEKHIQPQRTNGTNPS